MTSHIHPADELRDVAARLGYDVTDIRFAQYMDEKDELQNLRKDFFYPKMKDLVNIDLSVVDAEEDCVYFCGNSLGLCPRDTKKYMDIELDKWAKLVVEGHFKGDSPWAVCDECLDHDMAKIVGVHGHRHGDSPWAFCDECLDDDMAQLVGANKGEVAIMNGLTVNLHLLMISFYRPTKSRHKILCESKAFPSDHYAFESQIKLHGFDPEKTLICLEPREGEVTLRTEDILKKIEEEGDEIALVCFSGVQYYTGQLFDIEAITGAAHRKGCYVGWDLAHAAGNVPLHLHDWEVDFACWCSYKYICGSAGGLAAAFLHEKHSVNDFPKLLGWWGHNIDSRFVMDNNMELSPGIYGYRISNPPGFLCPPLKASLQVFNKTTMEDLRKKSKLLTAYLELLINLEYKRPDVEPENEKKFNVYVDILTPYDPNQRGAQLSLKFSFDIHVMFEELQKRGVVCDKRLPDVIRLAPVPMYCSFEDVSRFMKYLKESIKAIQNSVTNCEK